MQDRPTALELLKAVERFLDEQVVPNTEGTIRFHARVSANVMRIVARELEQQEEGLSAEWTRLDELLGTADRPETLIALREGVQGRTEELCRRIRTGEADSGPFRDQVMAHVRQTVRDKLAVTNPDWLARSGPAT
jgi:hypothetical protein